MREAVDRLGDAFLAKPSRCNCDGRDLYVAIRNLGRARSLFLGAPSVGLQRPEPSIRAALAQLTALREFARAV